MFQTSTVIRIVRILVLLASSSTPVVAQTWVKSYSFGASTYWATSIRQTTDGGFLTAGFTEPPGDAWITKLDPIGEIEWSRAISGWPIWPHSLETLDGGFVLAGAISIQGADGCYDVRFDLAKFGPTGALEWHKQYGPDQHMTSTGCVGGQANPRSIIQTPDGSLLMSGMVSDGSALEDLWLVKVDASGSIVWQKSYGSPNWEYQYGGEERIGYLPGGGIVLVGQSTGYSVGGEDVWVLWLDANGAIVNQRAYGGSQNDYAKDLFVSDDGNVTVAAESSSFGYNKPWLLTLDPGGAIISQRTLDIGYISGYPTVLELPNGNLAVGAVFNDPWSIFLGLAEVSSDGGVLWSKIRYPQASFPLSATGIAGGGLLVATLGDTSTYDYFTLTRTDASGGIDADCPLTDAGAWIENTTAAITPSNATAATTSYPTVDMTEVFWAPTWEITEHCITLSPQIYVHPSPVDFGSIPMGATSSQTVTVANTGTANLLISNMTVGLPFVLTASCAGFNLIPGGSPCEATIELTPDTTGPVAANLTIESNDPTTPLLEVPVLASVFAPLLADGFESGDTSAWSATVP